MMKQFISQYFSFTKKERNGTLALLVLILVLIMLPFLFPLFIHQKKYDHNEFKKQIASLAIKQADTAARYHRKNYDDEPPPYFQPAEKKYNDSRKWDGELFYFDPNTLDESGWKKLGVRDKTIATLKNYLSKGGKFYKAADIRKIWGLNEEEKARLEPYIKIENANPAKNYERPATEKLKYSISVVDVNTADTTALIALPGIGSKLAQRIIAFREKLGGFYKIDQLAETFGLPDSTFQKIKPLLTLNTPSVQQININTATLDDLKSHPYLRYAIANAIVQYRTQHGNFSSVNDLKKIAAVTAEVFVKALPYLKIN